MWFRDSKSLIVMKFLFRRGHGMLMLYIGLVFAYGLLQTGISPLIGSLVDHFGFTPVCWLVALPPLGGWLLLRKIQRLPGPV